MTYAFEVSGGLSSLLSNGFKELKVSQKITSNFKYLILAKRPIKVSKYEGFVLSQEKKKEVSTKP